MLSLYNCIRIDAVIFSCIARTFPEMDQIFDISFRPFDRRKIKGIEVKTNRHGIIRHLVYHFQMRTLLSYHTFFFLPFHAPPQTVV